MASVLAYPIDRRTFLRGMAAGAASLYLDLRTLGPRAAQAAPLTEDPRYRTWEDVYRERWVWDKVAASTHGDLNCIGNCAWRLYIKDDIIWREEQTARYEASNPNVPDFNPAGCQKGATCSQLMRGPARLRYPLKRVGKRGEGRWKRIGWDEALDEVAKGVVDTLARRGGEGIVCEMGTQGGFGAGWAGTMRFFRQIGAPVIDSYGQVGDLPVGSTITYGLPLVGGSADNWFQSRCVVLWEINPIYTRIPYAHFLTEARYRGAKIITVAPDYNASAIHADLWLSVRPGSDAALALAACRVIMEEKLHKPAYIREQTDLPFLVRGDTHRFLREADVKAGGREDRFACWDETKKALFWAPGTMGSPEKTLKLSADQHPALEAKAQVRLASGKEVEVRTVFSVLRDHLAAYEPEKAAQITGISAETIRRFAREFAAAAPAAMIIQGAGQSKHYHGDLLMRAEALLLALTGSVGHAGGGWDTAGFIEMLGPILLFYVDELSKLAQLPPGQQVEMPKSDAQEAGFGTSLTSVSGTIFHAVHGGMGAQQLAPAYHDPTLPRSPEAYLKEALAKGPKNGITMAPAPGAAPPEVVFNTFGNVLRSSRMGNRIRDTLFTQAKLVVELGIRMNETSRYADIVLPAAGMYEKVGVKYTIYYVPYLSLADSVVPPQGEAKPEWEIFSLLAERVGVEASKRGVSEVRGSFGQPCQIGRLGERFSDRGTFGPKDEDKLFRFILRFSRPSAGITWEELRAQGAAVRFKDVGPEQPLKGLFSDYRVDEPMVPARDFVEKKQPYPTLTGRQQFYIDAPIFLEVKEQLPVFKEPTMMGGNYPFTMTCGHTRWSIHSIWRDQDHMLRLQRGEPVVYINDKDAKERGIADHDWIRVSNDLGAFLARAKPTGAIRPKQVHIYHAWEPYQFRGGTSDQHLSPSPIKVTQLTTDYGHLRYGPAHYDVNQNDRDTRVDIGKA
ncbi:MAG: molybdopterin-dependent oxidoreductase [Candidatus Binatia bacterium]